MVLAPWHTWEGAEIPLVIEPGMAFGTGHHETTRLALKALARHLRPGDKVLDLGTGSGVLAIAAEKLGGKALGVDIDPMVLPQAEANAKRNGVRPRFWREASGPPSPSAPFDLLVANLYAELHAALAPRYREALVPGGGPSSRGSSRTGPPWCARPWRGRGSGLWRRRPRGSGSSSPTGGSVRPHRAFSPGLTGVLPLRETRHLVEVLRARVGDRFTVFDGEREALAEVVDLGPPCATASWRSGGPRGRWGWRWSSTWPSSRGTSSPRWCAPPRSLGPPGSSPSSPATPSPRRWGRGSSGGLERWPSDGEAVGAGGGPRGPPPIPLKAVPQVAQGLVAHVGATARVREVLDPEKPLALAVGPEGGFAEEEVALLEARGFTPVSLGRRILRAETAALALLALCTAGEGR